MEKKLFYPVILLFALLCISGCSNKNSLSPKQITKIINMENAKNCTDIAYCPIEIGYYELNDDNTRYQLRQLAAAGIITYKCEIIKDTIVEKTTERYLQGYSYWGYGPAVYGTRTNTTKVPRTFYFVDVQLTDAGNKIMVETLPTPPVKEEDVTATIDSSAMPEFSVPREEFPKEKDAPENDNLAAQDMTLQEGENDKMDVDEPTPPSKYDLAKQKENKKTVYLKAYKLEAIIAKDVLIKNEDGIVSASASVIMEYTDISPVGRIYYGKYEKTRSMESYYFRYFEDKGWQLCDEDVMGDTPDMPKAASLDDVENGLNELSKLATGDKLGNDVEDDFEL